ncbi:hypothetical protein C8R47DRAFT_1067221 [Mycena vitilis]|nr:hypothetical protein C8R47DRAFT_1067221 [Mycena vitilis]
MDAPVKALYTGDASSSTRQGRIMPGAVDPPSRIRQISSDWLLISLEPLPPPSPPTSVAPPPPYGRSAPRTPHPPPRSAFPRPCSRRFRLQSPRHAGPNVCAAFLFWFFLQFQPNSSRRLPFIHQIPATIAYRLCFPQAMEGFGAVYLNFLFAKADLQQFEARLISLDELLHRSYFKIGETTNLPRRQQQYRVCDRGAYQHHWVLAFHVPRRLIAEKVIYLALGGTGTVLINRLDFKSPPANALPAHPSYPISPTAFQIQPIPSRVALSKAMLKSPEEAVPYFLLFGKSPSELENLFSRHFSRSEKLSIPAVTHNVTSANSQIQPNNFSSLRAAAAYEDLPPLLDIVDSDDEITETGADNHYEADFSFEASVTPIRTTGGSGRSSANLATNHTTLASVSEAEAVNDSGPSSAIVDETSTKQDGGAEAAVLRLPHIRLGPKPHNMTVERRWASVADLRQQRSQPMRLSTSKSA